MSGAQAPSNIPIPDPSVVTGQLIAAVRVEFRDGLAQVNELINQRITYVREQVSATSDIIKARLDGMDKTHILLQKEMERAVGVIGAEAARLEVLFGEKLNSVAIKFGSIETQFAERDTRARDSETAMKESAAAQALSGTTAVNAALQAQKESAFATQQSNKEAIQKSETGFQERIKALETLIDATKDGLSSSISELRSRLDRGEGSTAGGHASVVDARSNNANIVGIVGGVVGVLALVAMIFFNMMTINRDRTPPIPNAIAVAPLSPSALK